MGSSSAVSGVRLLGVRALVEKVEIRNKAGLYLPDSAKDSGETANVCRVVCLGDGRFINRDGNWGSIDLRVKVGELVVVDPKFVLPVRVDGKTYGIIEEDQILMILDREMEVL